MTVAGTQISPADAQAGNTLRPQPHVVEAPKIEPKVELAVPRVPPKPAQPRVQPRPVKQPVEPVQVSTPANPTLELAWDVSLAKAKTDFASGRFFDCLIAAKKAARLGAGLPAFLMMGRANLELDEAEEAASAFRSALVLDPGNTEAQRGLKRATGAK
jgi:hypothetical protein